MFDACATEARLIMTVQMEGMLDMSARVALSVVSLADRTAKPRDMYVCSSTTKRIETEPKIDLKPRHRDLDCIRFRNSDSSGSQSTEVTLSRTPSAVVEI